MLANATTTTTTVIQFQPLDLSIFALYFVSIIAFGVWLARREKATARDYFLAGDKLPWYAIGGSVLASNISTEHFVGMVGWAYVHGMVIANFEWGAWLTWSLALWFFLPFYLRSRIYTMPEFLQRRYGPACRYLLSITSIITYVTALEGAVLFAGAKALNVFFDLPLGWGVVALAVATAAYTITGGLLSVVWTDTVQAVVFLLGGAIVTVLGLTKVGGIDSLMHELPQQFHIYHLSHEKCPIIAYYICSLFVGAYYISSNQFMVQRCLGARSDWDGRMGLLFSNYLKLLMPFVVVLPGIIAFKLFPGMKDPDQAYPRLVSAVAVPGLVGLMMAALASAIMSTLSSAANSASTLLTMDIIRPLWRARRAPRGFPLHDDPPEAEADDTAAREAWLVRTGQISTAVFIFVGMLLGLLYSRLSDPVTGQPVAVFSLIMNIFFFIGPPLSIVFLAGIFWPRATPAAAVWTIVGGYVASLASQYLIFAADAPLPETIKPLVARFNNFLYVAIFNGVICLIIMMVATLFTRPRPYEEIRHLIWRPSVMWVEPSPAAPARGTRSLAMWWGLCMALTAGLYLYFAWFQFG